MHARPALHLRILVWFLDPSSIKSLALPLLILGSMRNRSNSSTGVPTDSGPYRRVCLVVVDHQRLTGRTGPRKRHRHSRSSRSSHTGHIDACLLHNMFYYVGHVSVRQRFPYRIPQCVLQRNFLLHEFSRFFHQNCDAQLGLGTQGLALQSKDNLEKPKIGHTTTRTDGLSNRET